MIPAEEYPGFRGPKAERQTETDRDIHTDRQKDRKTEKGKTEENGLWPRPLRISLHFRFLVQSLNLVSNWLLNSYPDATI